MPPSFRSSGVANTPTLNNNNTATSAVRKEALRPVRTGDTNHQRSRSGASVLSVASRSRASSSSLVDPTSKKSLHHQEQATVKGPNHQVLLRPLQCASSSRGQNAPHVAGTTIATAATSTTATTTAGEIAMVDTPAVVHAGAGTPAVGNALHAAAAAAPSQQQQQQIMLLVPYRSDAPVAATHERDSESFPLILSGMDSLRPEEQRTCPIVLEEFNKVCAGFCFCDAASAFFCPSCIHTKKNKKNQHSM